MGNEKQNSLCTEKYREPWGLLQNLIPSLKSLALPISSRYSYTIGVLVNRLCIAPVFLKKGKNVMKKKKNFKNENKVKDDLHQR